jgi:hypothetical protein
MLRSTLRQMASISGRAILAIGLTSATVLALAPSAKADVLTEGGLVEVLNPVVQNIEYKQPVAKLTPTINTTTGVVNDLPAGTVDVISNAANGYTISATSGNTVKGSLVGTKGTTPATIAYSVKLTHATLTSSTGYKALTTSQTLWDTTAQTAGANLNVSIDTGVTDWRNSPDDTYSDTITFTIAPKS